MQDDFSLRITIMPPESADEDDAAPTEGPTRPLPPMKRSGGGVPGRPRPTTAARRAVHPALASPVLPATFGSPTGLPPPPIAGPPKPHASSLPPPPIARIAPQPTPIVPLRSAPPATPDGPMPAALPPPPMMAPLQPMPMLSPLPAPLPLPERDPMLDSITPLPGVVTRPEPRMPRATLAAVRGTLATQVMTSPRRRAAAEELPGRGPSATPARGTTAVASVYDDDAPTVTPPRPRRVTPTAEVRLTPEERRERLRAHGDRRRSWALDLLRRFQF